MKKIKSNQRIGVKLVIVVVESFDIGMSFNWFKDREIGFVMVY